LIEEIVNKLETIKESAAIAVSPSGGGPSQLVIYLVLNSGKQESLELLKDEIQKQIRRHLNPLVRLHNVLLTDHLPRIASNKIMRCTLRGQYEKAHNK